jgi:hypothetical protein
MPVSVEYQLFSALNYNWKSTDAANAPLQIDAKLNSWITAVNANSVNASKQVTALRNPLSSTGTRVGWVIRFADGIQPGFMFHFASIITSGNNTSGARGELFPISGWTDNTTNDGYGGIVNVVSSRTSIGWYISGAAAEFIIASSSDPGQEFFILGWNMANNTPYRDVIAIFKDTNGNWAVEADDGGSYYGIFQNPDLTSNVALQGIGSVDSHPFTNSIGRIPFITSSNSYTGGQNASNRLVYPAHPKLWITSDTAFNFGGYYAANNRVFYGVSQRNWVVETT